MLKIREQNTTSEVWKGIKYNPPLSLCIEIEKIINIDLNIFLKGYYLTNIKKSYSCMRTLALFYVYCLLYKLFNVTSHTSYHITN